MPSKYIKVRCAKHNKWFALEVEDQGGEMKVINFVGMTEEESKRIQTEVSGTSFHAAKTLRRCVKCGTDKVGTCKHPERLGLCDIPYSYQCLFCDQLRINNDQVDTSRLNEWVGISNIPGANKDRFGNPQGSQYDLAKDDGFKNFKIVIVCLYTGEGILKGIQDPIKAMMKKGFEVDLCTSVTPNDLRKKLKDACQLWVISDSGRHLNDDHLAVIREFYEKGRGLYIFGDNAPFFADANFLCENLIGTKMHGNTMGDHVIGVQTSRGGVGMISGHPISTGIVNLYEGITIATVNTTKQVEPLVMSSAKQVVTAIVDDGKHRALIDGGFTRLYVKWDTAGTDRFVVNCAAWLASGGTGGELRFT